MSATSQGSGAGPTPVVDVMELARYLQRALAYPTTQDESYTDDFTGRKTDFATAPGGAVSASRVILNSDIHAVLGWSITETTGTGIAQIRLHDGGNANNEVFTRVNLAANESVRDWFIPKGIRCTSGRIFLEVITGSVEGVVYWL